MAEACITRKPMHPFLWYSIQSLNPLLRVAVMRAPFVCIMPQGPTPIHLYALLGVRCAVQPTPSLTCRYGGLDTEPKEGQTGEIKEEKSSVTISAGAPHTVTLQVTQAPATVRWQYLVSQGQVCALYMRNRICGRKIYDATTHCMLLLWIWA